MTQHEAKATGNKRSPVSFCKTSTVKKQAVSTTKKCNSVVKVEGQLPGNEIEKWTANSDSNHGQSFLGQTEIDPGCAKAFDTDLYQRNPPICKT